MLTTEEIRQFMEEDNVSQKKQFARKGQEYYDGDHDISCLLYTSDAADE